MKDYQISRFLILTIVLLLNFCWASAQNEYEYEVAYKDASSENQDSTKVKEIYKRIAYGHWSSYKKATEILARLENERKENYGSTFEDLGKIIKKEGGKTTSKGKFTFAGTNNTCVIFIDEDCHIFFIKHNDGKGYWNGSSIAESPDKEFNVTSKSLGDNKYSYKVVVDILSKKGIITTGTYTQTGDLGYNFDYEDGYERFKVKLTMLPADIREDMSRIVILPYAMDCDCGDTIAYLAPAVYEGGEYHNLQDKRKSFSYEKVDTLGKKRTTITKLSSNSDTVFRDTTYLKLRRDKHGKSIIVGTDKNGADIYLQDTIRERKKVKITMDERDTVIVRPGYIKAINRLQHKNGNILIDTTIVFKKPDKKKTYRGMVRYSMEDYHHEFFENIYPGTCLHVRPFKFLEVKTTAADLPLSEEFLELPEEGRVNIPPKDLGMFFNYGTSKLIEDSAYMVTIQELERDMNDIRISGGELTKATLTAYASPDGSERVNMELSRARAAVAKTKIHTNAPIETRAIIDTWANTALILEKEGHLEEAELVRAYDEEAKGVRNVAERKIKAIPTYKEIIKPAVDKQCRIEFTYEYFAQKVLTPQEAVNAYRNNKHRTFSNGDYYNIFSELTDSLELDSLTEIAYERVIKKNGDEESLLAPYIINRKALLSLRQGLPDTTILAPLIYDKGRIFRFNDHRQNSDILFNRPEIILNQAIMFYLLNEPTRARFYVNHLKDEYPNLQGVQDIVHFLNFKDLVKIPAESRTEHQKKEFQDALTLLENAAVDNRAVLYTEFESLKKRDQAWDYVHLMDDNNPKKWYLMALLWAFRDGLVNYEADYPLPAEDEDSIDHGDSDVNVTGIPYYMAYFWKSFDLDKSAERNMMRYYFEEGYITEEMRKKKNHAFKFDRIPAYKKLFRLRKIEDDKYRSKLIEKQNKSDDAVDDE